MQLASDKGVVLQAAREDIHALEYASMPLRSDASFILQVGGSKKHWNPKVYHYVGMSLWTNMWFVKELAKRDRCLLQRAHALKQVVPQLLTEKTYVLQIVR